MGQRKAAWPSKKIGKISHKLVASGSFEEGTLDETNGFKAPTKEIIGCDEKMFHLVLRLRH